MTVDDAIAASLTHDTPPAGRLPRLRVGVLLGATEVPAWQHATLAAIAGSGHSEIVVAAVVAGRAPRATQGPLTRALRRVVDRLDEKMVCEVDALEAMDARTALGTAAVAQHSAEDLPRALAGCALDVLVDLCAVELPAGVAASARRGIWRVTQPYSTSKDAAAASFWPVYHGWPVGEAVLEQERADGTRAALFVTTPATNPFSLKLNASALCWRAAALVPQALERLHRDGAGQPAEMPHAPLEPPRGPPGASALAAYIGRNVIRRARASAARRFTLDQWILLYRFGDALSTAPREFSTIVPPKDRFWADPHLVKRDGRYYAFIEECPFDTGKGHLAVMEIDADGACTAPVKIIERDYHLSYPFVFEHEGELYMVPESSANRTVDLYRCTEFPRRWEYVRTLLTDIAATDSTLVRYDGRWWLFANVADRPGASFSEELYLFHSDSLHGAWTPHRRNPVISDARRARPAGAVIERGGRLLRPAQDCSVRYGYGVRLHEIVELSEDEYREREIERVEPTWDGRIVAVHTLSHVPGLTMMDALQPRLRF